METDAIFVVLAFICGAAAAWLVMWRGEQAARKSLATECGKNVQLVAELAATRDQFATERKVLNEQVRTTVEAAAAEAFCRANEHLLKTANETFGKERATTIESVQNVLSPIVENLSQVKNGIDNLDKQRLAHAESMGVALSNLTRSGEVLREAVVDAKTETARLSGALKDNRVRGKWGEISLERVVEFAGMQEHVHFDRQRSQGEGVPDVTIHIPGNVHVPIDAKAPLDAYCEAMGTDDPEQQRRFLTANAQALRARIKEVSDRAYHMAPGACGFSILYVPLESVLSAALASDPDILEYALDKRVSLASPLTLIPQLRAFATAWALHNENVNAERIVEQAKILVERLFLVGEHLQKTGKAIESVVKHWNGAIGSFDTRLTVTARNILALTGREIDDDILPQQIETTAAVPQRLAELPAPAEPVLGNGCCVAGQAESGG